MNKLQLASLLAGLGLLLAQTPSFAGTPWTPAAGAEYVQDQVLIKFKPGVTSATRAQLAQTYGAQSIQAVANLPDVALTQLAPGQTVAQAISAYANDPNVASAQPNYIYHTSLVPNDPQYLNGQLWAAKNTGQTISSPLSPVQGEGWIYTTSNPGTAGDDMNLVLAWNVQTDCSTVLVAVVDSGVNYNQQDLAANMWTGNALHGNNFAADGAAGDPMDLNGHGTHVAGIIGAVGNNAIGGTGVCWAAKLMAVRVMDATGSGFTTNIISGINYAVTNGAKVINMSLGGTGTFDPLFSNAITTAQSAGTLVVVAAGNDGLDNELTPHWPCNFTQTNLICVAALDQNYNLATFSDWGATSVDVGAPGTNIYSTWAGTSAVINDFHAANYPTLGSPVVTPAGWTFSSTTAGGWAGTTGGYLIDPAVSWGTALYNANTDDRAYKTFNLAGANAATMQVYAAINVISGDFFNFNYKSTGGDPFAAGGVNAVAVTNWHDGNLYAYPSRPINISPCISATCSLGIQLKSGATTPKDFGVLITNFSISTLTLNATNYNTLNGTSMATPEVAGVAALVWAHNPLYTYADVANAIKNGGRPTAALSGKTTSGNAVDALKSLAYINPPTGIAVVVH